jgi:hypothetical protein
MATTLKKTLDRANDFLDRYVLPWPVRFLTYRFVILITIGLLIPLIVFSNKTIMVLAVNSYLNTMSVAVSSIVLLYATISEARQKQIAEMQEKRAMEDHLHVVDMHNLIMQTLQNQSLEMAELKQVLEGVIGKEIIMPDQAGFPDGKSLHVRGEERFTEADLNQRWEENIHHNMLVSTIRKNLQPCGDDRSNPIPLPTEEEGRNSSEIR